MRGNTAGKKLEENVCFQFGSLMGLNMSGVGQSTTMLGTEMEMSREAVVTPSAIGYASTICEVSDVKVIANLLTVDKHEIGSAL